METPPASDSQLGIIASQNGCLYSGPTQITLSTTVGGVGQMTVVSPDTIESTVTVNGTNYTWDNNNISANLNNCPNNGTAPLPANGVVFVQNAPSGQTQQWANPFDNPVDNTATNLTSNPNPPQANRSVTLTATVKSVNNQLNNGATVAFSQTTITFGRTQTAVINSCSAVGLSNPVAVTPATNPPTYTSTATCSTTEASNGTGAFSASYSGGNYTSSSSANLGQSNTLTPSKSYGPLAQVTAGGCTSCYYGQTSSPTPRGTPSSMAPCPGSSPSGRPTTSSSTATSPTTTATGLNPETAGSTFCQYNTSGTNDVLGLIAQNYAEIGRPVVASTRAEEAPPSPRLCRNARRHLRPLQRQQRDHHRRRHPRPQPVLRRQQLQPGRHGGEPERLRLHPAVRPRTGRHLRWFADRLHQALHVGPAAQLHLPAELPGPLDGIVGPAVHQHQRRQLRPEHLPEPHRTL